MSLSISTTARNAAGTAITGLIDLGSTNPNGYLEVRTGTKPTSPQVAATGTLLATLQMSNPAFKPFSNGQAQANPIDSDTSIAASGVAGWFRIYNCDGVAVIDGDVSASGGTGDIQFDNTTFLEGGIVAIQSLAAIMPP